MQEQKELILIKLGGSVITDKTSGKEIVDKPRLNQLAEEIHVARTQTGIHILLAHGAGSFGHPPAQRYNTINGLTDVRSLLGMAEVREAMLRLNLAVIQSLVKAGEPAITIPPVSFVTSKEKVMDKLFTDSIVNLLNFGLVPVIHGDVITDSVIGSTIFSGEQILNRLALELQKFGYHPKMVIEVGTTDGVYNNMIDKKTIPQIDQNNFTDLVSGFGKSSGVDVTGGMAHKVEEALSLAETGIPSLLISGRKSNLEKALMGQPVRGTWIR